MHIFGWFFSSSLNNEVKLFYFILEHTVNESGMNYYILIFKIVRYNFFFTYYNSVIFYTIIFRRPRIVNINRFFHPSNFTLQILPKSILMYFRSQNALTFNTYSFGHINLLIIIPLQLFKVDDITNDTTTVVYYYIMGLTYNRSKYKCFK